MNLSDIYSATLPIVATQNLVMGLTLILTYKSDWINNHQYRTGGQFMGTAMLFMAIINYVEYIVPTSFIQPETSVSIVAFAASIQLCLILYAYISLLNPQVITKKRIISEFIFILLFTVPPLFVNPVAQPLLYYSLFYLSMVYYTGKYFVSIIMYKKQFGKIQSELSNFYSDEKRNIPDWIEKTFYTFLTIGAISILVPFTNYGILILYQLFLFVAYFYIFYKILYYKPLYINPTSSVEDEAKDAVEVLPSAESILFPFDKWIAERHYATPSITIEDVASQLKTNRTTLSLYLNSELKVTFYEWISKIRVENACKLIEENPSLPIPDVAIRVGIENRSNFDKLFKRIVGMSPATYRLQFIRSKVK